MKIIDAPWKITPRHWQAEALPVILKHYAQPNPEPSMLRAIMGSGKSILIAQILACLKPDPDEVIIVSTPKIILVEQLEEDIRNRLDGDFMTASSVGTFYSDGKDTDAKIIIACIPSLATLAERLSAKGRRVAMWILDEAHRSQTKTIQETHASLLPERVLGFSATPYLANEKKTLTLFTKLIYDLGPDQALKDGIVVGWKIVNWDGPDATLDEACIKITENAVGPGVFSAMSIADAEVFAQRLKDKGKLVEAIHSELTKTEIRSRLADLKSGKLWAVTHVDMLTEGFNAPYLKFLCLRRRLGSRVAFVQMLGRLLRAYPGKTEAVIYDLHSLLEVFSISPAEALGGECVDIDDEPESEKMKKGLEQMVMELMRHLVKVEAGTEPISVDPLKTYLTTLVSAFDVYGLIDRKIASRSWRSGSVTNAQELAIRNMGSWSRRACVPPIHAKALSIMSGRTDNDHPFKYTSKMNRGTASDLMDIFRALCEKKQWPSFKNLDEAATSAIERARKKFTAAAGAGDRSPVAVAAQDAPPLPPPAPKLVQGELF